MNFLRIGNHGINLAAVTDWVYEPLIPQIDLYVAAFDGEGQIRSTFFGPTAVALAAFLTRISTDLEVPL